MLLYFRMLVVLLINLYCVRIVLKCLGVEDYGIYNVIGGFVALFTLFSDTMASAMQRFFAVEIGRKSELVVRRKLFTGSFILIVVFVFLVALPSAYLGNWFIENYMTLPIDRVIVSKFVLYFSIIAFVFRVLRTPFNALLFARESFDVYAIFGLIEVLLKLLSVFVLAAVDLDKLLLYSVLVAINMTMVFFGYYFYCRKICEECDFVPFVEKTMLRDMLTYSSWNALGTFSNLLRNHVNNILINLFFGPTVNTGRAIGFQVNSVVLQFSSNFYTAVKPQITKEYAKGGFERSFDLVRVSSKYAFSLMAVIVFCIFFNVEYFLKLWLGEIPPYAIVFTKLFLINALVEVLNIPIVTLIQAHGRIAIYQILVTTLLLLNVPVSYVLLKFGYSAEVTVFVSIIISIFSILPRLVVCKTITKMPYRVFLRGVLLPALMLTTLLLMLGFLQKTYFLGGIERLLSTIPIILFFVLHSFG